MCYNINVVFLKQEVTKKDEQKNKGYMSYRKKNKKKSVFNQSYDDGQNNNNIEIEEVSLTEQSKGLKIDIFG